MTNIYTRIGEAVASSGKIDIVLALQKSDEAVLELAGFIRVGIADINGTEIGVYRNKSASTANVFSRNGIPKVYASEDSPYKSSFTKTKVTFTVTDNEEVYNPLSILESFFFPLPSDSVVPDYQMYAEQMNDKK